MHEPEAHKIYKWLKWPIDLAPIVFFLWVFTDPFPVHRPPWFTFLSLLEDVLYFYLFWGMAAFFLRWAFWFFMDFALYPVIDNLPDELLENLKNNDGVILIILRYEDKIKKSSVPYCYIYAAGWGVLLAFLFGILFRIGI